MPKGHWKCMGNIIPWKVVFLAVYIIKFLDTSGHKILPDLELWDNYGPETSPALRQVQPQNAWTSPAARQIRPQNISSPEIFFCTDTFQAMKNSDITMYIRHHCNGLKVEFDTVKIWNCIGLGDPKESKRDQKGSKRDNHVRD